MVKGKISLKIIFLLLISNVVVISLFVGLSAFKNNLEEYKELNKQIEQKRLLLPQYLVKPLTDRSDQTASRLVKKELVERILLVEIQQQDVLAIAVRLATGDFLCGRTKDEAGNSLQITTDEHYSALINSSLSEVYQRLNHKILDEKGQLIGHVHLFFTDTARKLANFEYIKSLLAQSVIQAGISIIIIFLSSLLIIVRPLRTIVKKTKELAEKRGDLTQKLAINSEDEIGQLAGYLNKFIDSLNEQLWQIKESATTLNHSIDDLSLTSYKIVTTSNHQAASVKEIVSTMEDSDSLTKSIATGSHDVVELAQNSKKNVQEGYSIMQSNQQKMDEIKITNARVLSQVRHLDESIKNISKILNIITSVADQTKIIAFNAELDAFQAGAAGKNFEIVANEIRRLADNTIHSTKEIKKSLEEIQNAARHLNISSQENAQKISEGWQLSNKVEKVFDNILHSSEVSTQAAEKINLSIRQNSTALEQIFVTLKQLAAGVSEIAETTQNMSTSSNDIKQMANNLEQIVHHYHLKPHTD
jgi:methyl-accepting chemotaxis protein